MRRRLIPLLLLGSASAFGQAGWMHMYADEGGYRSTYSAIEHGSTYLFFGSGISSGTWLQPDVILIKTDPLGDTVATRELNFPDLAVTAGLGNSLIELHDGGMLLVGSAQPNGSLFRAGHLIWFVSSLDTIRTLMVVDTFDVDLNAVIENADSSLVVFGWGTPSGQEFFWAHLDPQGGLLESRHYPAPNVEECYSGCRALDGGYLLSGVRELSATNTDVLLRKVAADGSEQWTRTYGNLAVDNSGFITALPDTTYLVACGIRPGVGFVNRAALLKVDPDGDELWMTLRSANEQSSLLTRPIADGQGRIVAAGTRSPFGIRHGLLMAYDESGAILWERSFMTDTLHDQAIYDLRRTMDDGYLLSGYAWDTASAHVAPWLIKVDSLGCIVPGCQLFDDIEEQRTGRLGSLTATPNPASTWCELDLSSFLGSTEVEVRVVSALGREIVHTRRGLADGSDLHIDLGNWTRGVYFVHVVSKGTWLGGTKLIVE